MHIWVECVECVGVVMEAVWEGMWVWRWEGEVGRGGGKGEVEWWIWVSIGGTCLRLILDGTRVGRGDSDAIGAVAEADLEKMRK